MNRVIIAVSSLLILFTAHTNAQTVGVMSYNIRYANKQDGPNVWKKRKDSVAALVLKYHPEILGTQEVLSKQLKDLQKKLKHYGVEGVGRDDGKTKGEYSAIFYNKDSFERVDGNTFWLSDSITKPSKGWDADLPRIATWCKLKHKRTGSIVFAFNTHFDHAGRLARINSASLIKQKIKEIAGDGQVILTGDLNSNSQEVPYRVLTTEAYGYALTDIANGNEEGTYCGFEVGKNGCLRIDYIFCSQGPNVVSYAIPDDNNGSNYPSDHKPVLGTVELLHKP
jgi:endonuclease/exonuclease/phosphatase family metal-dependent hydrolase